MGNKRIAIAYDIGTTGVKTCLFDIGDTVELLHAAMEGYKLYVLPTAVPNKTPPSGGRLSARPRGRFLPTPASILPTSRAFRFVRKCRDWCSLTPTGSRSATP